MRLRDLQTFKEYLKEDDDGEDIVSGLRKLVTDIRTNWRSPFSSTRNQELKIWKKLSPGQQDNLHQVFKDIVAAMLDDISRPINLGVFRPTTRDEAAYIPLAFQSLSQGAAEIGKGVLTSAEARGIITPEEANTFMVHFEGKKPMDLAVGAVLKDFITAHRAKLATIVAQYEDDGISFKVPNVRSTFLIAIESKETPPDKKKAAVQGIHYMLLKMSSLLYDASKQLESKYSRNSLPDEAPQGGMGASPGGIKPPVTKP